MTAPLLPAFAGGAPQVGNVYQCDALALLKAMPAGSVDCIVTDPPYGFEKTKTAWDSNGLPFDVGEFMRECLRVVKRRGAVCIFACPPFNAYVMFAALDCYRYSWYYEKPRGSNFGNSHYQPLRVIEEILVFSSSIASPNQFTNPDDVMIYFPQGERLEKPYTRIDKPTHRRIMNPSKSSHVHNPQQHREKTYEYSTPYNVLYAATDSERGLHPTQKPTVICGYLIRTYTEPDMLIVDPFCGSGTTAVAAFQCGRRFIAGDTSPEYVEIARRRLRQTTPDMFATQEAS